MDLSFLKNYNFIQVDSNQYTTQIGDCIINITSDSHSFTHIENNKEIQKPFYFYKIKLNNNSFLQSYVAQVDTDELNMEYVYDFIYRCKKTEHFKKEEIKTFQKYPLD